ncbi:tetratricopeptide repeat protein [Ferrimonas sp. SCSIO 43195]|uniref:tetratricopeptide repeat protein n=1 Tax=Ferrimonas sp. SCSIO 43195 TaxID=2822844 RepID=UPI002075AFCD|nr:tetratricopeptide repeat protein [Ferrimonas sp. SCSIO 43195]USD39461.1 tetratricopeptide repeat protein [Ferrimonas sp. SCSIO 43195]
MFRSIFKLSSRPTSPAAVISGLSLVAALVMPLSAAAAPQGLSGHQYLVLKRATKLLDQHHSQQAAALIAPLLEAESVPAMLFHYGCRAFNEAGEAQRSAQCWQQGLKRHPDDGLMLESLAQLWLEQQDYAKVAELLASSRVEPTPALQYLHGYALYQLRRYSDALHALTPVSGTPIPAHWRPLRSYSLLALEDWPGLEQDCRLWLVNEALSPNEQVQAWQLLAQSLLQQQRPLQAATALQMADLLSPNSAPSTALLQLYGQLDAYDLAADCSASADQTLSLNCLYYGFWAGNYATTLAASERLTASQSLPPQQADRLLLLQGQLLSALNRPEQARAQWHKVGKAPLKGDDPENLKQQRQQRLRHRAQALLAIAQSHWLSQQWPEAMQVYRELAQLGGYQTTAEQLMDTLTYYTQPQ